MLGNRNWNEISAQNLEYLGLHDELRSLLTREALAYYLPSLMQRTLESRSLRLSRLKEVTVQLVLPTRPEYKDVWEYFGDGLFRDWGTEHFMQSTQLLIEKVEFVRASYTLDQRECVARYIEIVESCGAENPDEEFLALLKKFADFWRQ